MNTVSNGTHAQTGNTTHNKGMSVEVCAFCFTFLGATETAKCLSGYSALFVMTRTAGLPGSQIVL